MQRYSPCSFGTKDLGDFDPGSDYWLRDGFASVSTDARLATDTIGKVKEVLEGHGLGCHDAECDTAAQFTGLAFDGEREAQSSRHLGRERRLPAACTCRLRQLRW